MTELGQDIFNYTTAQVLKPKSVEDIKIKDIIHYLHNTENLLHKINLKPHLYFPVIEEHYQKSDHMNDNFNELSEKNEICVISHNDVTGRVMLRLLRYVINRNDTLIEDKKRFEQEINGTDTMSNVENFVNYLSLMQNYNKFSLDDTYVNDENKINISDVNIWTLKGLRDNLL